MTLDIIVPHYKESWDVCKYLFDSIAMQRGIDFKDINVLMINDGSLEECFLSYADTEAMQTYPFKVYFIAKEHAGVSAARNYGLFFSKADYVMFCDADDGFLNNYGLHLIFKAMSEGSDYICSAFVEETFDSNGNPAIVPHNQDLTFMHGKAYKRSFLMDNNIRFDPAMTVHEDGYFNSIACVVAKVDGKYREISTPIYLWRWNENSVVRSNREDFVLRTYPQLMQTRIGISEQLRDRGYEAEFETSVVLTVLNSYYDMQKTKNRTVENERNRREAESAFKKFYNQFKRTFQNCTNAKIAEVADISRANARKNGFLMESEDLRTWLKHIEREVI